MRKMKKVMAAMLAATMVMSMSLTALAAELPMTSKESTKDTFIKTYELVGSTDTALYPAEKLLFTSTPDTGNPDTTNLSIDELEITGNSEQKLTINIPSYSKVGIYKYVISETPGATQGVTYSNSTFAVSVLVEYDYEDADQDGHGLKATLGITSLGGAKSGTFTNTYSLGALKVSKEVTGNMASQSQKFNIDVTFTSDKEVLSAIPYGGNGTIAIDDWSKEEGATDWTVTKTISIAHGEDVTFSNIPVGVQYTVAEQAKHLATDTTGSNEATGYSVTYSNYDGVITVNDDNAADEVKVTNSKGSTVDTGIALDSMPYFLLLAIAALGMFGFVSKKHSSEF